MVNPVPRACEYNDIMRDLNTIDKRFYETDYAFTGHQRVTSDGNTVSCDEFLSEAGWRRTSCMSLPNSSLSSEKYEIPVNGGYNLRVLISEKGEEYSLWRNGIRYAVSEAECDCNGIIKGYGNDVASLKRLDLAIEALLDRKFPLVAVESGQVFDSLTDVEELHAGDYDFNTMYYPMNEGDSKTADFWIAGASALVAGAGLALGSAGTAGVILVAISIPETVNAYLKR